MFFGGLFGWMVRKRRRERGGGDSALAFTNGFLLPPPSSLTETANFSKKSIQAREGEEGGREGVRMEQETEEKSPRL